MMAETHRMGIHGIDSELFDWLRARAARHGCSMSTEAKTILAEGARNNETTTAFGRSV